jgi:hypothetical protein
MNYFIENIEKNVLEKVKISWLDNWVEFITPTGIWMDDSNEYKLFIPKQTFTGGR